MGGDSDSDLDLERPNKGSKKPEAAPVKEVQKKEETKVKKRKEERPKAAAARGAGSSPGAGAGSDSDLNVQRKPKKRPKEESDDLAPPRPRAKTKDKEEKKVSRKAKPQDLDSDGSDLQLERPKKEAKSEKDQKVPPKAQKKDDSDSDVPRRPAPGGFDRLEPSRSRDPKGKGDGFGFGKGDGFGKGTGKGKGKGKEENDQPKEQPNFEPSGLLALEDNAKNGIPLKFTVPAEARRPATKWRLYVFSKRNGEKPKMIHIYKNVGYLFGKDRRIVDVPTDHPTCSKQHAVLHYRQTSTGLVKPYIMDLESVNGTFVNGSRIDAARYVELREKDVLKFGMSSREFVLLHGGSANHVAIDAKDLKSDSE